MTNEEHGRDADEDGEEAPLGAVGHLQAEGGHQFKWLFNLFAPENMDQTPKNTILTRGTFSVYLLQREKRSKHYVN